MKILIATQCFPPDLGGIEHVMGNIAIEASEAKHTVFVVSDKSKSPSRDFDDKNNITLHPFDYITVRVNPNFNEQKFTSQK